MTSPSTLPFTSSQALPIDLYEPLFATHLQGSEFQQWLLHKCSWRLCIIGPPGSGKTTLSSLVVRRLQGISKEPDVSVTSIFFTRSSSLEGNSLAYQVLKDVWSQLSAIDHADFSVERPSQTGSVPALAAVHENNSLKHAVISKLSRLKRGFLVLDDIDLCDRSQWVALDALLAELQNHGMNVMTTSRLSLWNTSSSAYCDTNWLHEHGDTATRLFWYCVCQDSVPEAERLVICQNCRDGGYNCLKCNQSADSLKEPYDRVDILLDIRHEAMSDYVGHALELAHGDLGLSSGAPFVVAHSKLGMALVASENTAMQLRDKIVIDADGNIAMAKLRLDVIDGATTVEEVVQYGDRLPANIVSLFDSIVANVQNMSSCIEHLGLRAIVGIASRYHGRPFSDLQSWLRKQRDHDSQRGDSQLEDFSIEDVLRSAAGCIVVDREEECRVRLYHGALVSYAVQGYNEALFWMQTSTSTMKFGEFGRPVRRQTSSSSRRDLTRANTWK